MIKLVPLARSTLALCKIYCLQRNCPALWYDDEKKECSLGNVLFADKLNEIVQPPTALEVYADLEMAPSSSKHYQISFMENRTHAPSRIFLFFSSTHSVSGELEGVRFLH